MVSKKLAGSLCYLSPLSGEFAESFYVWLNDLENSVYLRAFPWILTLSQERQWLETIPPHDYVMAIIDARTNTLLGNCGLVEVDFINRTAEYGIFIGEKEARSKGIGSDATMLMLDYGFNVLNLHNIKVHIYSYNEKSLNLFRKCGFKMIGRRREAKIIGNQKYDEVMMDLLATEFEGSLLKKLFKNE
ncbi:MAG: GNAT family N-acetyltransferase [Microscillaceae bacterium]|jgi:RimJ/RimL family protein N-acetyltransferase|nr:GNAT family N-acetyltransferase [Microscillaceae bacterium]